MTRPYAAIRVADVATSAGVSSQTVHTHFESKEVLFLTAAGEIGREIVEKRNRAQPGDVTRTVAGLVAEYEQYGDVNWSFLTLEADSPAVSDALRLGRSTHRAWLTERFATLLPADPARRRRAVDALYAATDVGTWKLLRRDLGLSRTRTRDAMEQLVRGALTDGGV